MCIGMTPNLRAPSTLFHPRHREIAQWITNAGYAGPWLALDDDRELFDGYGEEADEELMLLYGVVRQPENQLTK